MRRIFFKLNYLPKLSRIKSLIQLWSMRDITPLGRIHILKTFAISQFVYLLSVLPDPPASFFKQVNGIFFRFIWNGKKDKIKGNIICNSIDSGGLNMIDLVSFAKGLKCKWVKMYTDDNKRPWKALFDYNLCRYGAKFLF